MDWKELFNSASKLHRMNTIQLRKNYFLKSAESLIENLQSFVFQSALFGRSFLYVNLKTPKTSTRPAITQINEKCTDVIRNLRLINHLQHINIGMPITYKE